MRRALEEMYNDTLQTTYSQARLILDLQEQIEQLEEQVAELEQNAIMTGLIPVTDEDLEELDAYVFLRELGFDPDNLPSLLGERMAIRDALGVLYER